MIVENITIRKENPEDYTLVHDLLKSAFANEELSDQSEHILVDRLRSTESYIPDLSLVVEFEGEIVGYILFTKISIGATDNCLALAPVAVNPNYQNRGIGSQLVTAGHEIAISLNYNAIALVGHQEYYPRFGYVPANKYSIDFPFPVPLANAMVLGLQEEILHSISGTVTYDKAFFE